MAVDVGGSNLETLGIRTQLVDNDVVAQQLRQLGTEGEAAAQRITTASAQGASSLERAYTESVGRTRQVVETQLNTLIQLTANLSGASKEATSVAEGLVQGLREEAQAGELTARQLEQLASAERALASSSKTATGVVASETATYERRAVVLAQLKALDENAARSGAALSTVTRASAVAVEGELPLYERRAVVLSHMAALEENAARAIELQSTASKGAAATALLHGSNLGRIAQEAGTAAGRVLGLNTVLTRLGASVAGNVIGFLPMIAALGAITLAATAVEKIYDALTEQTRKAKEEQDKLTASLEDWYRTQQQGPAGELPSQIDAIIAKVRELKKELENENGVANAPLLVKLKAVALADLASLLPTADFTTAGRVYRETIKRYYEDIGKEFDHDSTLAVAAIKAANEKVAAAIKDAARAEIDALASAISSGRATGGETSLAQNLLADYERQLAHLQQIQPPASSGQAFRDNLAQQAELLSRITTLTGAFTTAERTATEALKQRLDALERDNAATVRATDEYTKQAEAAAKVGADTRASFAAIQDKITLLSAEGIEHDRLANHLDFEAQRRKLTTDIVNAGSLAEAQALTIRRDALTQLERLNDRYIILAASAKYAKEAQDGLNQAVKNLKPAVLPKEQLDQSTGLTRVYFEVTPVVKAPDTKVADDAMRQFERSLYRDLSSAIADALEHGLASFRDFTREAGRLIDQLAGDIAAKKIGDLVKGSGETGGLAAGAEKFLGPAAIAATGLTAAYRIGQSNSTRSGAELSGGIGGLLIGGPGGATAGLVASLLGFSHAAKEAQKQIEAFHKAFDIAFQAFQAEGAGTATDLTKALAANAQQAEAFRQQTEEALAGKRKQTAREKELDAITAAEAANAKKIATDFWKGIDQQLNALNGPAGAYANQVAAIEEAYRQNIISADAAAKALGQAGISDADRAKILELETKALAAAKAAEADRLAGVQAELDARQAAAEGLSHEADVIRRRYQEQHELFLAEQQGYTDVQKAQLKYIQGLEDEAAAKQALADANATLAQNVAAGPSGTILDQQAANMRPLVDKLASDTDAYNAAVARLNSDLLNGADAATIAADQTDVLAASTTVAGDKAAIAAQQFADAAALMDQSASQIEKDVQLGFTTPAKGLAYEAQAFGFTGLSIDQIKALYTPFTGTPLTNEQIQQNKNIETYLGDFAKWSGQVTDTLSAVGKAQTNPATTAIVDAAQSLTEQTGTRMADTLTSIALDIHRIRAIEEGGGSVFTGSVRGLAPLTPSSTRFGAPVPFFSPQPLVAPATTEDIVAQLAQLLAGGGNTATTQPVGGNRPAITIHVNAGAVQATFTGPISGGAGSLVPTLGAALSTFAGRELAKAILPYIEEAQASQYQTAQLRDGNPTKPV